MYALLSGIQGIVHLLFFVVVVGTLGISWLFADRLRKQHNADFPWGKTILIVVIEVGAWIAFNIFFDFFKNNWLWITIGGIILIFIILSRKKRRY